MKILVSGVPGAMHEKVEAEIRAVLATHDGDINVVVTKLPNGAWITFVFDARTGGEVEVPELAERLAALANFSR